MRTPWCGKPGCEMPPQRASSRDNSNNPLDFKMCSCGCHTAPSSNKEMVLNGCDFCQIYHAVPPPNPVEEES